MGLLSLSVTGNAQGESYVNIQHQFSCFTRTGGEKIIHAVIRIWYSVCITEEDFILLTSALQDLGTTEELSCLSDGVMEIFTEQLNQLKNIWTTWLRLTKREGSWLSNERKMAYSFDPKTLEIWILVTWIPSQNHTEILRKRILTRAFFPLQQIPKT